MNPVIYKIDFGDGRFYVGSSIDAPARIRRHRADARVGKAVNKLFQAAFNETGSFTYSVIAVPIAPGELHVLERLVIESLHPPLNVQMNPNATAHRMSAANVCRRLGVDPGVFYARRHLGWTVYESLGLAPRNADRKSKVQKRCLTLNGKTMPLDAWAKLLGVSTNVIHSRLHSGWSVERTLTTPIKQKAQKQPKPPSKQRPVYELNGVTGTIRDLADHFGVSYSTLYHRIKSGWLKHYWLAAEGFPYNSQPDVLAQSSKTC